MVLLISFTQIERNFDKILYK